MAQVYRLDLSSGETKARKRTPQGGLVADANLTRTGVFEYRDENGGRRRELRSPEEVFDQKSLASYPLAPLTVDHPGRVGPDNWKTHAVGHVGAAVRQAGHFVAGEVHVQHGGAMERAENGELSEISCGYHCDLDPTPGTYMGQPYDAVQRNIRINHVALGPKGWGRMGPETRMHMDSGAAVSGEPLYQDAACDEASAKAREASNSAATKRTAVPGAHEPAPGGKPSELPMTPQHTYGHDKPAEREAGMAHLKAAAAHKAAAAKATTGAERAHHEQHAAAHNNSAEDHARAAGDAWDHKAHPLNAEGKFDSAVTPTATFATDGSHREPTSTMTPEEKLALEKAQQDATKAAADLEKARQDAKDAKGEAEKAAAKAREDAATIASLTAENQLLKLQQDRSRNDGKSDTERKAAEAALVARTEEMIALRADAALVFATVDDPQGKQWKADGKNADAIRREVLAHLEPSFKFDSIDGLAQDGTDVGKRAAAIVLKAVYDKYIADKRRQDAARAQVDEVARGARHDGEGAGEGDDDGEEMPDAEKERKGMLKRKRDAWKMPRKDRGKGRAA